MSPLIEQGGRNLPNESSLKFVRVGDQIAYGGNSKIHQEIADEDILHGGKLNYNDCDAGYLGILSKEIAIVGGSGTIQPTDTDSARAVTLEVLQNLLGEGYKVTI